MQYKSAIENSKVLFEKAKTFFTAKNLPDCVIEISDKPFEEWVVDFILAREDMYHKRHALYEAKKPFIVIYKVKGCTRFFFNDKYMLLLQVAETGEILAFRDRGIDNYELDEVRKEFIELKKMLQGK